MNMALHGNFSGLVSATDLVEMWNFSGSVSATDLVEMWEFTYYSCRFMLSFCIVPQTVSTSIWLLVSRLCIWALIIEVVAVVIRK